MQTMGFGHLTVRFDDRVLRPRPWTLAQSLWAAELADGLGPGPILELCAGVGHIGLALAALVGRELVLVDADANACDHARFNAAAAGLRTEVDVRHGRMDTVLGLDERFPLVVADPPWVPTSDVARYPEDPRWAIDGGEDGLDLARTCLEVTGRHLGPGGAGVIQLGTPTQATLLADHLHRRPGIGLRIDEIRTVDGANGVLARVSRA
ncbi:MAG: class I SAM-dependent methyltransferase [Actinobacteria bacterium]|jgi:release factor glutamine methyltransferase|nr:class I SAM-dependent methyltransferase [Actinomycetota bacterium]